MNQDMINALKELERDKGIPFSTILDGLAEAMASAYKSWRRQRDPDLEEETFGVRAVMDPDTGDLRVWEQQLELQQCGVQVQGRGEVDLELPGAQRRRAGVHVGGQGRDPDREFRQAESRD